MNRHTDTLNFVNSFHQVFVIGIGVPDEKIKALRPVLIKEEFKELEDAIHRGNRVLTLDALCDLQYVIDGTYIAHKINKAALMELPTDVYDKQEILLLQMSDRIHALEYCLGENKTKSVDVLFAAASLTSLQRCLDKLIVVLGFEHTFFDAFCEVHRSNMSKAGPDGKPILREDGKALKGPNYTPPQLERFCACEKAITQEQYLKMKAEILAEMATWPGERKLPEVLTCDDCPARFTCEFAADPYNTDGDCLAEK